MKKIMVLSAIGLAMMLGACSNTVDNSGKTPSTTKTTTSKVSQKKKKDNREVVNGELLKPGQWLNDDFEGKVTLEKIWTPNVDISDGPLTAKITTVKILKTEPKTKDQLSDAKDSYQTNSITNPYYTIQVSYELTNTSDQEVGFNGIDSIVTTTGQQLSPDSYLQDSGIGTTMAAHGTKKIYAVGLLNDGDYSKIKDIAITLGSVYETEEYNNISDGSDAIKINLE
ncbi:hypothetical protein [Ligilactobacillus agilis]|uniref:hypothetical protein n=1 Tax=Ligilactobacillus agilis TaxID=1601 RepID=UPI00142F8A19|nr:hypothetical protein [Ligilactobacillus agilis]NJE31854.1 hypothetical protein [Ligilactobacillus agilis]